MTFVAGVKEASTPFDVCFPPIVAPFAARDGAVDEPVAA